MEYKIKTIKDIFEKVPTDRIEDCMKELTQVLIQSKNSAYACEDAFSSIGLKVDFPEEVVWRDDGKKEISTAINVNGSRMFEVSKTLKGE